MICYTWNAQSVPHLIYCSWWGNYEIAPVIFTRSGLTLSEVLIMEAIDWVIISRSFWNAEGYGLFCVPFNAIRVVNIYNIGIVDQEGKERHFICIFILAVELKIQSSIVAFSLSYLKCGCLQRKCSNCSSSASVCGPCQSTLAIVPVQ